MKSGGAILSMRHDEKNLPAARTPSLRRPGATKLPLTRRRPALRGRWAPATAAAPAPGVRIAADVSHWSVAAAPWIVAVIALIVFLKWAGELLVPLLLGIILTYTLAPLVNWLEMRGIPRALGAILVLSMLLGGTGWMAGALRSDAQTMINQLPDVARKLRHKITQAAIGDGNSSILRKVQDASQ
jgi:AI-2E family transporter